MRKVIIFCLILVSIVLGVVSITITYGYQGDIYEYIPWDETIYSEVTLNEQFADDIIIFVLTRRASRNFEEFQTSDFPEFRFSDVKCLTPGMQMIQAQLLARSSERENSYYYDENRMIDLNEFRRILVLVLAEPSKENVLEAIALLEVREDVMSAEPNFYSSETSDSINSYNTIMQPLNTNTGWWQNTIRLAQARNIIGDGQRNVIVGVIDSGINRYHADLIGRIANVPISGNFAGDNRTPWVVTGDPHGTPIAGMLVGRNGIGMAPNIQVASLRVDLNRNEWLAVGILFALQHATNNTEIRIINISIGEYRANNSILNAIRMFPG